MRAQEQKGLIGTSAPVVPAIIKYIEALVKKRMIYWFPAVIRLKMALCDVC
tara:strand:+ start:457 stop:609 length:153 start_codon:yes stop_codon:yes gene_type:complete